ncbi:MAG TPA: ion channel [Steroidobacteraceae bacterium]|jgi:voltage-gated potassium channel|nr:ion channel [Steroidobacteraceae bacterium]
MQFWFPHMPLALAVGMTGLMQLLLTSGSLQRLIVGSGSGKSIVLNVAGGLEMPAIRGIPQEAIGALLLVVGTGLIWRSRLAWVLAFLLTLATVSLELSPLSTASKALISFNVALLVLLVLSRRSFTRASLATSTLFALTGILFTLGYGILGSYVLGADFAPRIANVVDAVYFAVVTMSTVGYGDIAPRTPAARLFTVSLIVLGLVVFVTSLTAIVGPLIDSRMKKLLQPKRTSMKRSSHIIVVGDGPLARNALKALAARGLHATAIWPAGPLDGIEPPEDLVIGDGSDSEVLRSVEVEQARAVLALSPDDSYNAFAVLATKELNPSARTVVAVNNVGNTSRVMRVHPDVVLDLPMIGSELLAMALSGEEITADALINQLLKLG